MQANKRIHNIKTNSLLGIYVFFNFFVVVYFNKCLQEASLGIKGLNTKHRNVFHFNKVKLC